ncbi:GNAT family N-acetyltransferase [Profundibacter sp.]|uniref:GNAT family N-acetyltransferase n=1 Tax=Profundibacter sp. TaxID=3101071 RepID=UPI003D1208F9
MRWATPADYAELGKVMYDAVRHGSSAYSEAQRQAWVPLPRDGADWHTRLAGQDILVYEDGRQITGFISLTPLGYIDFAYVRPAAQGMGLFRNLYTGIETHAQECGITHLTTHASLMAQPAFAAVGFKVVQHEEVQIRGEVFKRAKMEKGEG